MHEREPDTNNAFAKLTSKRNTWTDMSPATAPRVVSWLLLLFAVFLEGAAAGTRPPGRVNRERPQPRPAILGSSTVAPVLAKRDNPLASPPISTLSNSSDPSHLVYLRIGVVSSNGDQVEESWNSTLRATWQAYILAQEDINADPTAFGLPANARIWLDMHDLRDITGSYNGAAMLAALNAYYDGAIAILGTDGSESTKAVAQTMGRLQIPQCSPWAGDDALSSKISFPYFFRTLSGASDDISYLLPVMKYFGWTQFSFIYCDSALGNAYQTALTDLVITDARWQITSKFTNGVWLGSDSTDIAIAVDQMTRAFADGTRVLFLAGNMDWMAAMLLFAYKAGLMRDDMVWLTTQDVSEELDIATRDTALTQKIMRGSFFGTAGAANTPASEQFLERLPKLDTTLYPDLGLPGVSNLDVSYACVQALAAGWGKFLADGAAKGDPTVTLENLASGTFNANFTPDVWNTGADSPVGYLTFDEHGDMVPAFYQIYNFNGTDMMVVGRSDQIDYTPNQAPIFRDGSSAVPRTALERVVVNSTWGSNDAVTFLVVSVLGIIVTLVTTGTIWMNRRHPVVKRASPAFSMLTLLGIIVGYCTIFPYIGIPDSKACVTQTWLPPVAFSLVYGSIAVKSWRLYKIFNHPFLSKNLTVKTPELLLYVTIQLAIQAVILITWAVYDAPHPISINISTTEKIWLCRSSSSSVQHAFEASLYGTNGMLMAFVLFLTWKNRAIDSSYNETSRIAAASWNFVALLAIGLPLVYLPALYSYQFIMRHVLFLLMTTFTLMMLFGPAVLQIAGIRANEVDLNEANKFMRMTFTASAMTGVSDSALSSSLVSNSVVVPVMIEGGIRTWLNRWEIFRVLLFPSMHHLYLVDDDGGRALMYRLSNVSIKADCTQDAATEAEPGGDGSGGHPDDGGTNADSGRKQAGNGADLILAFKQPGKPKTTVRMSFSSHAEQAHWHSLLEKAAAVSRSKTTSPTGSGAKDPQMNKDHALRGGSPRSKDVLKTGTEV